MTFGLVLAALVALALLGYLATVLIHPEILMRRASCFERPLVVLAIRAMLSPSSTSPPDSAGRLRACLTARQREMGSGGLFDGVRPLLFRKWRRRWPAPQETLRLIAALQLQ